MGTFYLYVSLCQTESICFVGVIIILFFLPESKAVASWPADHQYSHVSVYFGELLEVFILTFFHPPKELVKTSLVAQMVKRLSTMRRPGFNPWVGKIPWRREPLFTTVFWPGEFHGLYSPRGYKESDMTEWLSHFPQWRLSRTLGCSELMEGIPHAGSSRGNCQKDLMWRLISFFSSSISRPRSG